MESLDDFVSFYVGQLRDGDSEAAFHSLIEADRAAIPKLIEVCKAERNPETRAQLVNIIWEFRDPSTISFLGEALFDSSSRVWKAALDGLVALGCPAALPFLRAALSRESLGTSNSDSFRIWVEEAIEQLEARLKEDGR